MITPIRLIYFKLWAKGPAPALALSHAAIKFTHVIPDWKTYKSTTPFSKLPILETPDSPPITHELAILNHIATHIAPQLNGATPTEHATSQMLMCESEDIYVKLSTIQPRTNNLQPKCSPEELQKFWDPTSPSLKLHNRDQPLHANLLNLDNFATSSRFTRTTTIGDCKLFSTLHMLSMIDADVLKPYDNLSAFYKRFGSLPETVAITDQSNEITQFPQYFVAPPVEK